MNRAARSKHKVCIDEDEDNCCCHQAEVTEERGQELCFPYLIWEASCLSHKYPYNTFEGRNCLYQFTILAPADNLVLDMRQKFNCEFLGVTFFRWKVLLVYFVLIPCHFGCIQVVSACCVVLLWLARPCSSEHLLNVQVIVTVVYECLVSFAALNLADDVVVCLITVDVVCVGQSLVDKVNWFVAAIFALFFSWNDAVLLAVLFTC